MFIAAGSIHTGILRRRSWGKSIIVGWGTKTVVDGCLRFLFTVVFSFVVRDVWVAGFLSWEVCRLFCVCVSAFFGCCLFVRVGLRWFGMVLGWLRFSFRVVFPVFVFLPVFVVGVGFLLFFWSRRFGGPVGGSWRQGVGVGLRAVFWVGFVVARGLYAGLVRVAWCLLVFCVFVGCFCRICLLSML